MKLRCLALTMGLCCAVDVLADNDAGTDIRAGRAALETGQPEDAKKRFEAALSSSDARPEDRFAALMGLGRAEMWLGFYRTAHNVFGMAKELAQSDTDREVAETGLAQALNALDYPRKAHALTASFASGKLEPTLEVLKAQRALDWQDRSPAYLAAVPSADPQSGVGQELRQLAADADYALARRVEGGFEYQHDSDDLSLLGVSAGASLPVHINGRFVRWGVAARAWQVDDGIQTDSVSTLDATYASRFGDDHGLNLSLGPGVANGWTFLHGQLGWEYRPNDVFGAYVSAAREPILTPLALDSHTLVNTYTLGASFRPGDHWYLLPAYYHQDFNDGNRRDGGIIRILISPFDIANSATALGAEVYLRTFHSKLPGGGKGYFNPSNFHEEQLSLICMQRLSPDWKLRARLGAGSQAADGDSNPVYAIEFSLQGRLAANGRLKGSLGHSSISSQSGGGSGYWNNYLFLSIGFPF